MWPFVTLAFCSVGGETADPLPRASLTHQKGHGILSMVGQSALGGKKLENQSNLLVSRDSDLTEGFRSVRVWNQFQDFRWFSLDLV
jgi:hypothetical protein